MQFLLYKVIGWTILGRLSTDPFYAELGSKLHKGE